MNVFLNIEPLVGPRTGIGYYTQHLISELMKNHEGIAPHGLLHGRILYPDALRDFMEESASEDDDTSRQSTLVNTLKPLLRGLPGAYWAREQFRAHQLRKIDHKMPAGIYHEPNFIPLTTGRPTAITVHDVSHLRFPEHHPAERVRFLKQALPRAIRSADHIVTVSEFTRNELCHFFPEAIDKTTAIPLGVDECFRPRSFQETWPHLQSMGLMHGTYILSAATHEPRKNLAGLVKAYLKLPQYLRQQTPLVIAGGSGWKNKALQTALNDARSYDGSVIVTGRVSRERLANLISGARLFAYPSFYEGFGLPIAEARASGVPVLTSDRGVMKEVAGKDAILVDPYDFSDTLKVFLESETRPPEPYRFSWSETAKSTVDLYKKLNSQ